MYKIHKNGFISYIYIYILLYTGHLPGLEGELVVWFIPATHRPPAGPSGVSGCKPRQGHSYRERARKKTHLQPRDTAGPRGCQSGDRAPPLCAESPETSSDLPSQEAKESPAPKLAFPTPFLSRSHPPVWSWADVSCRRGLATLPRAEGGHRTLRWGGDSRTPHPLSQLLRLHPIVLPNSGGPETLPPHPAPGQHREHRAAEQRPGEREGLESLSLGRREGRPKPPCLETSQRRFSAPTSREFLCRGVQPPPPSLPFSSPF